MDTRTPGRDPIHEIGDGGRAAAGTLRGAWTDDADDVRITHVPLETADEADVDEWPAHFGAARLGIP